MKTPKTKGVGARPNDRQPKKVTKGVGARPNDRQPKKKQNG
jgi:hypothetical protein